MSIPKLLLRSGAAALLTSFAIVASGPAAIASPAQAGGAQTATDFSAARRAVQKPARISEQRRGVRNAYGASNGGPGAILSSGNFGYGDGDNSRRQTW